MSTEQLERETEETRAQLAQTLDELRTMSPGRVVDEVLDYAKEGGGEFLRNLGRQIAEHPLPATMIGAGIIWFMMDRSKTGKTNGAIQSTGARSNGAGRGLVDGMSDAVGSAMEAGGDMAERAGHALSSTKEGIQSTVGSLGHAASSAASAISGATSSAYDAVSETASQTAAALKDTASSVVRSATALEEQAVARGKSVMDFCMSQPLVLAGLGLAIGAALGAAIPETKAEDRLMGEAADALKDSARHLAAEQLDAAKAVGEQVVDETAKLVSEKASEVVERLENATEGQSENQKDGNDAQTATGDQLPSDERQDSQPATGGGASRPWEQQPFH